MDLKNIVRGPSTPQPSCNSSPPLAESDICDTATNSPGTPQPQSPSRKNSETPESIKRHKRGISTDVVIPPPGKRVHSLSSSSRASLTLDPNAPKTSTNAMAMSKSTQLSPIKSPKRLETHYEEPALIPPIKSEYLESLSLNETRQSHHHMPPIQTRSEISKENIPVLPPPPSHASNPAESPAGSSSPAGGSSSHSLQTQTQTQTQTQSQPHTTSPSPLGSSTVTSNEPLVSGEVLASGSNPNIMVTATTISSTSVYSRRHAHILSEQKRRENINGGFKQLKNAVPFCKGTQDSKATILKKAVDYIASLEHEVSALRYRPVGPGPLNNSPPSLQSQPQPQSQPQQQPLTNTQLPPAAAASPQPAPPPMHPHVIHNIHSGPPTQLPPNRAPSQTVPPHPLPPTPPPLQQQHHLPPHLQPHQHLHPPFYQHQQYPASASAPVPPPPPQSIIGPHHPPSQQYTAVGSSIPPNISDAHHRLIQNTTGPPVLPAPGSHGYHLTGLPPALGSVPGTATGYGNHGPYSGQISRAASTPPVTGRLSSKRNFSLPPDYIPAGRYTPPPSLTHPPRQF